MQKYRIILALSFTLLTISCLTPPNNHSESIDAYYIIEQDGLYYSDTSNNELTVIPGVDNVNELYYSKEYNLLLAASNNKLYFINSGNNVILKEIDIPTNPQGDPYILPSLVQVLQH